MDDIYMHGLRDGHHAATMASLVRANRSGENNAWFWAALAVFALGLDMAAMAAGSVVSWLSYVMWTGLLAANVWRAMKHRRLRKALLAELYRWKQDQPEAAYALRNMISRAKMPRNNNKGEEA